MEDRETPRMRKYGESNRTRIMMANCTASHFQFGTENFRPMDFFVIECPWNTSWCPLPKFQTDGFCCDRVSLKHIVMSSTKISDRWIFLW